MTQPPAQDILQHAGDFRAIWLADAGDEVTS